jgi:hypothetical protein
MKEGIMLYYSATLYFVIVDSLFFFHPPKSNFMKCIAFLLALIFLSQSGISQNLGIGTTNPNTSAKLDITSSNSGLLVPRMTTTDRNRIANPAKGLLVYDSTTNEFWFFNGSAWREMLYNNSVRFGFDLQNSGISSTYNIQFVNNYNLDAASVVLTNTTTITIVKPGLYRFGFLGFRHIESAPSATATSATFDLSLTVNSKQYKIIPGDSQTGASSNWRYVSANTILFDLFVPANSTVTLNALSSNNSGFVKTDSGHFFGYLISE